jgi:hypothetical protein
MKHYGNSKELNYLKNQSCDHDSANIAININSVTPDFLK